MTIGLLVAMLMTVMVGTASADPAGETFEVTCTDGIPDGWITVPPADALWTPGLQIDGTGVYIVYAVEFTGTFYPADGGDAVPLWSETFAKNPPKNTKSHVHGTCTNSGSELVDEDGWTGEIVFTATASVFWTGK